MSDPVSYNMLNEYLETKWSESAETCSALPSSLQKAQASLRFLILPRAQYMYSSAQTTEFFSFKF